MSEFDRWQHIIHAICTPDLYQRQSIFIDRLPVRLALFSSILFFQKRFPFSLLNWRHSILNIVLMQLFIKISEFENGLLYVGPRHSLNNVIELPFYHLLELFLTFSL